ncbi:MAG TPA: DUF2062 domain-containing protein [Chthoniobacterales bacterium]
MKSAGFFARRWQKLAALREEGDAVPRGFALGVALGFTPLFGLKTLLALLLAPLARGNRIAAVLGTTIHDVMLPITPALLRLEYDLGFWILQRPHRWPAALELHHLRPHDWLSWTTFVTVAPPLLVGSLIVAAPATALAYLLVRRALRIGVAVDRPRS